MNPRYNIPQSGRNMQRSPINNNGDRFFGGGFFGPFILGGLTGGLIANSRPNYGYGYPQVVYYPPVPIQTPYYSANNNYYYY